MPKRKTISDQARARMCLTQHRLPLRCTNTTGYKGVTRRYSRKLSKYFLLAQILIGKYPSGTPQYRYSKRCEVTEENAIDLAHWYDAQVRKMWGGDASVNFPKVGERSAQTGEIRGRK